MPLPLSIDHPTPVQLQSVFGPGYGTIAVVSGGQRREAPVAFSAIVPCPDYQVLIDRAAAIWLPAGGVVQVQASATAKGAFAELPVIEVFVAADRTFGESVVAAGWALPDETLLTDHVRRQQYVQALGEARSHQVGIWHESTAAELGLSAELDRLTAPGTATRPEWASHLAIVAVLTVLILLGWRERYWRGRLAQSPAPRRGLLRRFVALYVGAHPGFGKPLPAAPALPTPPASAITRATPAAVPLRTD